MADPQQQGRDYEKDFARKLGATVVPGSGNMWFAQLDVRGRAFLWSLKHTTKESFRLTRGMLHEARRATHGPGGQGDKVVPGMAVSIQGEEYVILSVTDFLEIVREEVKIVAPTKAEEKRERARIPKLQRERPDKDSGA